MAQKRIYLSEDWLATLVGLAIVLVIGFGLLGPGAQSVTLKAKPGETTSVNALAISGWHVSAAVGSEKTAVENAPSDLAAGQVYSVACSDGKIALEPSAPPAGDMPDGQALLSLNNQCDQDVTLAFTTDPSVHWPIFNLFTR